MGANKNNHTNHLKITKEKVLVEQEKSGIIRTPTGIPGFDELIQGGFVKGSINLISGDAGTNKSIFGIQFLYNGITKYNENGVFISFEEKKENVYRAMKLFGWDLQKLEDDGKFIFLEYTPEQVEAVIKTGGGIASDIITSNNTKRVVIDSITAVTTLYESSVKQRKILLSLFNTIRKWGCTGLLISEVAQNTHEHVPTIEEYEVDGDILLYSVLEGNIRIKYIEVFKMRGTNHSNKIYILDLNHNGLSIRK
ncbi:MAG TPA: ATPase domain-containing protein [Candidatus Woesearchaeota archaeon]|nr:ATPase domain-containing protein [Candidatus Woesearchaeota archaeon]